MLSEYIYTFANVLTKSCFWQNAKYCTTVANPLRRKKKKSSISHSLFTKELFKRDSLMGNLRGEFFRARPFVDVKTVRTAGGNGGDGSVSFLKESLKQFGGPNGGDGGNGAHVIFQATSGVRDLTRVPKTIMGDNGGKGMHKDCHGRNANHTVVPVPIGTIVRNRDDEIVADLNEDGLMFIAARGGAGGRGNCFFTTDTKQAPKIAEYGGQGENYQYILEVSGIANFGMLGFPNAGKSTLLQAISRAQPKVASYPFTTLQPHVGIIEYDDFEQLAVADLPGIIEGSHANRGLGMQFLRHARRCTALLMVVDISLSEPWTYLEKLRLELKQFDESMCEKPQIVIANKMDLEEAKKNLQEFKELVPPNDMVIPISAKHGTNLTRLLKQLKILHEEHKAREKKAKEEEEEKELQSGG